MNFIEKKVVKYLRKKEGKSVIDNAAAINVRKYDFIELFVTLYYEINYMFILDKDALERTLSIYCDRDEYKSLLSDFVVTSDDGTKRVDFGCSFINSNSSDVLFLHNPNGSETYIVNIVDKDKTDEVLSRHAEEEILLVSDLIRDITRRYNIESSNPKVRISEDTRKCVLANPSKHLNCPPKVFAGKFYTDEEWAKRSSEILSRKLPDGKKPQYGWMRRKSK